MHTIEEFFNGAYSKPERYWWKAPTAYSVLPEDHKASLIAQQVLRHCESRPPGRAVDLGSGEGADAIRLARLGWEVHALELTSSGVEKIKRFASEAGVTIHISKGEISHFQTDTLFDLVICNGVLHYIQQKQMICDLMQRITVPGGANVISLWSDFTPVPNCHQIVPTYPDGEDGIVVHAYASWTKSLLYFERNRLDLSHDDMPPHIHSFIKMIARKPEQVNSVAE